MYLFKELKTLQKKAYAPYSKYLVAAIAVDYDNNLYYGVNIENASYGVGTCAERVAIASAITHGIKKIKAIHLISSDSKTFGTPCGACRQFMSEFMGDNNEIIIYNKIGDTKTFKFKELLPNSFRKSYFKE